jgi:hypothetical protein
MGGLSTAASSPVSVATAGYRRRSVQGSKPLGNPRRSESNAQRKRRRPNSSQRKRQRAAAFRAVTFSCESKQRNKRDRVPQSQAGNKCSTQSLQHVPSKRIAWHRSKPASVRPIKDASPALRKL